MEKGENSVEKYDIFISYRREGGDTTAMLISNKLQAKGYKVFFDLESMRSGDFNDQIYDTIDICTDVILVLPPNGLDRCVNEDDWVRRELSHAIKKNKNIIPVLMRNFEFPEVLPDCIDKIRRLEGVTASVEYFDAVISRIEKLLVCCHKEELPDNRIVCDTKIKIPMFLRTPVWEEMYHDMYWDIFTVTADRYWWNIINSDELPEEESALSDYLFDAVKKKDNSIPGRYFIPYFIEFGRMQKDAPVVLNYGKFREWKNSYDKINDIYLIPKRYRDDSINTQELMHEVSDLTQTCFYNEKLRDSVDFVCELVLQGKSLIGGYSRKEGFSFEPVIDFCMKCFAQRQMLLGYPDWDHAKYHGKNLFKKVSLMIEDCTNQYGVYEDAAQILNTRVKLFLKYFQLISYYLSPGWDGKKIGKYLMINYKYMKKHKVVLTKENEELFERLINVYSKLKLQKSKI